MKRNVRRGFTLAEVLVTVTITAVLAAVVVPSVINQVKKGDSPSFTQEIGAFNTAVSQFAADNRSVPDSIHNLTDSTGHYATWKGPYLSSGQDLTKFYHAAAYGIVYNPKFAAPNKCAPANFLPVEIDSINGKAALGDTTAAFDQLYKDLTSSSPAPLTGSTAGSLQYTAAAGILSSPVYVCMIAAKVG